MATAPAFNPNAPYSIPAFDPNKPYDAAPQHDFSSLTANPKGEGTYQIKTADGQTVAVPYSNVPVFTQGLQGSSFASPDEQARFAKDAAADPQRPSFWNALTNPVGSGAHAQGLLGGAEQVGGQAIKTMAQPVLHPIDTLAGLGKVAGDALYNPTQAGVDVVAPMMEQYAQDKQRGGTPLAAENVAGQVLGNAEGTRAIGSVASGVEPSATLGAAGEAPAAGAEGPVNAVGGMNRLIPEAVRNGSLPSAWNWAKNDVARPALAGDVNAPIPGTEPPLTPAARFASMERMGVQPNAADATNSRPLNMAERVNQNSLTAAPIYQAAHDANLRALNRYTDETLDAASPQGLEDGMAGVQQAIRRDQASYLAAHNHIANRIVDNLSPVETEVAGPATAQQLLQAHADVKNAAQTGFDQLDEQMPKAELPGAADVRTFARKILADNQATSVSRALEPGKALQIMQDVAGVDDQGKPLKSVPPLNYGRLQRLRGDLLEFVNTNPDLVKSRGNGWISQLAGKLDAAMTEPEGPMSGPQVQLFRDSNAAWKANATTFDNPQHPFYSAVRTVAPSQLPTMLSQGLSRTPELVGQLRSALGEAGMGAIQRAVLEKALGTTQEGGYDFNGLQGRWNKLPEAYRKALFSPSQTAQIEGLGAVTANDPYLDPQSLHYKIANAPDPSTLLSRIPQTPQAVRTLQSILGPKGMGPIQRAVAESALKTTKEGGYNFKTFQGQWNKLPQAYREALFTPEQQQKFADIGNAGTVLHLDANPSASAKLGQQIAEGMEALRSVPNPHEMVGNAAYHALQYAVAKGMHSPTFVNWLMRDMVPTAPASGAGALVPAAVASGALPSSWDWKSNRGKP